MEVCANKNPLQSILCGGALGTHRFQRAVSAGGAFGNNGPSSRDCTLEAMRTQGAPPDSCAIERGWRGRARIIAVKQEKDRRQSAAIRVIRILFAHTPM